MTFLTLYHICSVVMLLMTGCEVAVRVVVDGVMAALRAWKVEQALIGKTSRYL